MKLKNMLYFILCVLFYSSNTCFSQLIQQPRRLFDTFQSMSENGNKAIARGDSMELFVDLSATKTLPLKDDFRLRVYNNDNNITLCDTKLLDYVHEGQYPCRFSAGEDNLRHGVNHLQMEMYSGSHGSRYASQKIPDIYLFDDFLYGGFYDSFYPVNSTDIYAVKTVLTSIFALCMAYAIDSGPTAALSDLHSILSDIKIPVLSIVRAFNKNSRSISLVLVRKLRVYSTALGASFLSLFKSLIHMSSTNSMEGMGIISSICKSMISSARMGVDHVTADLAVSMLVFYDLFTSTINSPAELLIPGN